jgi:hypothetical protein
MHVRGMEDYDLLRHTFMEAQDTFKKQLSATVPLFYPWTDDTPNTRAQVLEFDDSDDHIKSDIIPEDRVVMNLNRVKEHVRS